MTEPHQPERVDHGRRRWLLAAGAAGLIGAPKAAQAGCLVAQRNPTPAGWRVFRAANPPLNNSALTVANYASWPCTDAVSADWGATQSTWTGGGALNNWPINAWYSVWANRCARPNQTTLAPNPVRGPTITHPLSKAECRANYTSIAKANAATRCLIRYWLGRSDYMDPWLRTPGGSARDFVFYDQLSANPAAYFTTPFKVANSRVTTTYATMVDRPWLPSAPRTKSDPGGLYQRAFMMPSTPRFQAAPGIVLDFEVGDGRTSGTGASAGDPEGSLNLIKAIYADLRATADSHGQAQTPAQLVLFTDPLNGPSMSHSGLDASNLYTICQSYADLTSIQLFAGNPEGSIPRSYADQIAVLQAGATRAGGTIPFAKLFLTIDVAGVSASDAQFAYGLLKAGAAAGGATAPKAVWFWNDGADSCSSGASAKIAAVLQGPSSTLAGGT